MFTQRGMRQLQTPKAPTPCCTKRQGVADGHPGKSGPAPHEPRRTSRRLRCGPRPTRPTDGQDSAAFVHCNAAKADRKGISALGNWWARRNRGAGFQGLEDEKGPVGMKPRASPRATDRRADEGGDVQVRTNASGDAGSSNRGRGGSGSRLRGSTRGPISRGDRSGASRPTATNTAQN
jgi:hypothetical protein